jgi:hypothetical protein
VKILGVTSRLSVVALCAFVAGSAVVAQVERKSHGETGMHNSLVALYTFSGDTGDVVHDRSAFHNDGVIVGPFHQVDAKSGGISFDGASYVRIPSSHSLSLSKSFTVSAWLTGRGSDLRFIENPFDTDSEPRRAPYFQVVGDKVYLAYNADVGMVAEDGGTTAAKAYPTFIATVPVNLSSWDEHKVADEGVEPKIQVLSDGVRDEFFGKDDNGVYQIWTAVSDSALRKVTVIQDTHLSKISRGTETEAIGNIRVVQGKVYFPFPSIVSGETVPGKWELWTALSNADGSGFKAALRMPRSENSETSYNPRTVAAGHFIYYSYDEAHDTGAKQEEPNHSFIARSRLDGSGWHIIATFDGRSIPLMTIARGRLIFAISGSRVPFRTGSMDLDGGNLRIVPHSFGAVCTDIQAVGNRVYYSIQEGAKIQPTIGASDLDGSNWSALTLQAGSGDPSLPLLFSGLYKDLVIVGGKTYYGLWKSNTSRWQVGRRKKPLLGTSGANLVSKGDAYGIGLSEKGEATAFVNVGQDYLYRGEAPLDTAGATAIGRLHDGGLHQVSAVFDGHWLTLYLDGLKVTRSEYITAAIKNEFPLLLGDGLVGTLKEVRLYNQALDDQGVMKLYQQGRSGFAKPDPVSSQ